jgi:hypothetical protein
MPALRIVPRRAKGAVYGCLVEQPVQPVTAPLKRSGRASGTMNRTPSSRIPLVPSEHDPGGAAGRRRDPQFDLRANG